MLTKLRTSLLPLLLLLSCQQNDHSSHPSYPVIEEFLADHQLRERFGIQRVMVDRLSLSDAQEYRTDSLVKRTLNANYELTLRGQDREYISTAEVTSPDSVNWTMALFTVTEYDHRGSTDVKTTHKWDLRPSSD